MEWRGANRIMLSEYFDNKILLSEKKHKLSYINGKNGYEEEYKSLKSEIENIECSIRKFISSLDSEHLKSLLYMSLDME